MVARHTLVGAPTTRNLRVNFRAGPWPHGREGQREARQTPPPGNTLRTPGQIPGSYQGVAPMPERVLTGHDRAMKNHADSDDVTDAPESTPEPQHTDTENVTDAPETAPEEQTGPPEPADTQALPTDPGPADPQVSATDPGPQPRGPAPAAPPPPPTDGGFFGAVRRLGLPRTDDRWIGGVCAGLAHRIGVDPLLVRGVVAVSVLVGGFGFVFYGVAWALLPEARDGRIHLQETIAGRFDPALLGALGMVLAGLVRGNGWLWWGQEPQVFQALSWLVFFGVVVTVVVVAATASDRNNLGAPRPSPTAGYPMATPADAVYPPPSAAGWAPPPPAAGWAPPPPPVYRRNGPGRTTVGVVVALVLLATAGLMLASRAGHLDAPVALVAAGVCVVLTGLGIVVSGLRGRRSGVLGFIAIITLVVAGPWAAAEVGWRDHADRTTFMISDLSSAEAGVNADVGEIVVDLRNLPLAGPAVQPEPSPTAPDPSPSPDATEPEGTGPDSAGPDSTVPDSTEPDSTVPDVPAVPTVPAPPQRPETPAATKTIEVPVELGVGTLTIILPEGVSARVNVELGAGQVHWDISDHDTVRGASIVHSFSTDPTDYDPPLVVRVNVGVGKVTIKTGA